MSKIIITIFFFGILFLIFPNIAKSQSNVSVEKKDRNIIIVGTGKTLQTGGKVTYIVVKETTKLAWKTTKFTTGKLVAPVAKAIVVKAAPKVTLFVLKRGTPIAAKLLLTYIKL